MKKVAIRKLNRTQLKKEATKEIYITGKILLDFFGYDKIEDLATSRREEASKKVFYQKKEYFNQDLQFPFQVMKECYDSSNTLLLEELMTKGVSDDLLLTLTTLENIILNKDYVKRL